MLTPLHNYHNYNCTALDSSLFYSAQHRKVECTKQGTISPRSISNGMDLAAHLFLGGSDLFRVAEWKLVYFQNSWVKTQICRLCLCKTRAFPAIPTATISLFNRVWFSSSRTLLFSSQCSFMVRRYPFQCLQKCTYFCCDNHRKMQASKQEMTKADFFFLADPSLFFEKCCLFVLCFFHVVRFWNIWDQCYPEVETRVDPKPSPKYICG